MLVSFKISLAMFVAFTEGTEISKPSSPVYPQRVMRHSSTPHTDAKIDCMKCNDFKSTFVTFCNDSADFGPWRAMSDLWNGSKNFTLIAALGLLRVYFSYKCQHMIV